MIKIYSSDMARTSKKFKTVKKYNIIKYCNNISLEYLSVILTLK